MALPIRLARIAVTTPYLNKKAKYNASRLFTGDIVDHIIGQNTEYNPNQKGISYIKNNLGRNRENMSKDQIRANDILQQPSCNSWLNINYHLNK